MPDMRYCMALAILVRSGLDGISWNGSRTRLEGHTRDEISPR